LCWEGKGYQRAIPWIDVTDDLRQNLPL
jgi:hypothetical protein